jgi:hypothetical protein
MAKPIQMQAASLIPRVGTVSKMLPHLSIPDAMKLAKYSDEEVSNRTLQRFLQRALPGGSINMVRAILAGEAAPPNRSEQHQRLVIEHTPPPFERSTPPPVIPAPIHHEIMLPSTIAPPDLSPDDVCNDGAMAAAMSNKRKQYNWVHYFKKISQHINHNNYDNDDSA